MEFKKIYIAKEYEIPQSTLSTIIKNKSSILQFGAEINDQASFKRNRPRKTVNTALVKWFEAGRKQNLPISGPVLQQKALNFAQQLGDKSFKASSGWLEKFKKRYGIVQKKICGESATVNEEHCNTWIQETFPALLAPYDEKDIFNADETGLVFKCLPDKTLSFKNEKCYGGKLSKERVTCLLAANMTGTEKLKIVLIGKSAKPRCFRGVTSLPLTYKSNKKAWMTADLFESWLLALDKYFLHQNRKVLLIIDNCPAHPQLNHKLRAIKLTFFPPNMTSKLQPLDQGIINCFKLHYRQRILKKILDSFESHSSIPKIDLLDCINIVAKVWNVDVTQTTIHNCFRKAGFGIHNFYDQEDEIPLAQVREKIIQEQQMTSNIEDILLQMKKLLLVLATRLSIKKYPMKATVMIFPGKNLPFTKYQMHLKHSNFFLT
ncbi:tigger transposable element-derived protein 4-like isoform X2 [Euwallacea fornicatus]|uniref:tigger transposable element-derived protein 4-like isoform X2 n=1 Tax=Euwallacea fornicatus TaxID=995702 RepID=UPI00338D6F81